VPSDRDPYIQQRIPTWYGPIKDSKGRWISSHIINQDVIAWVGQGTIADRSKELLGSSDRGIAMVRNRFFEDMEKVARGKDPTGIIRDPKVAKRVPLPIATPEVQRDGIPTEQWRKDPYFKRRSTRFPWQYGQPESVWTDYATAMGVDPKGRDPGETKPV
jgi:5,5'-dehydrodivanillate O-demethylase